MRFYLARELNENCCGDKSLRSSRESDYFHTEENSFVFNCQGCGIGDYDRDMCWKCEEILFAKKEEYEMFVIKYNKSLSKEKAISDLQESLNNLIQKTDEMNIMIEKLNNIINAKQI